MRLPDDHDPKPTTNRIDQLLNVNTGRPIKRGVPRLCGQRTVDVEKEIAKRYIVATLATYHEVLNCGERPYGIKVTKLGPNYEKIGPLYVRVGNINHNIIMHNIDINSELTFQNSFLLNGALLVFDHYWDIRGNGDYGQQIDNGEQKTTCAGYGMFIDE